MKTQGRREVAEQVVIGTLIYACSELAAWGLNTVKQRIDARKKAEKKRRKAAKERV